MIDKRLMADELIRDEGRANSVYADSLGYWTIGVGRLVDGRREGKLSEDEVDYLLQNDIQRCLEDVSSEPWFRSCQTDAQRRGLLNMRFQLGAQGLRTFKNSLNLIAQQRFKEAGIELRKSKWYQQTPVRAERVIRQIEG